jgi:hypothetical protein
MGPAAATIKVEEDVDSGPPWGALPVSPVAATTEVEEDVDGGPPGGCYRWIQQWPPLRLKNMLVGLVTEFRERPPST